MANPVIGIFNEMWGKIESCWQIFVQNEYYVMSATVGYLCFDKSKITKQNNAI